MRKRRRTRHSLVPSILLIVMCATLLIGGTFAWFSDSSSTSVNKVQAGKLDVALEMSTDGKNWTNAEGKTLEFQEETEGEGVTWLPGNSYALPKIRIVNKGDLALNYKVLLTAAESAADLKLAEALNVSVAGYAASEMTAKLNQVLNTKNESTVRGTLAGGKSTDPITITVEMDEDAGIEYQGLSLDHISVTIVATQAASEYDSSGKDYDANSQAEIRVTPENIQSYLDGEYGSIDGMTLVLTEGTYDKLYLGRATKYAGSNTEYRIGGFDSNAMTLEDFLREKSGWSEGGKSKTPHYTRYMSNVSFKAAEDAAVTVEGIEMLSGTINGGEGVRDYVKDENVGGGSVYFLAQKVYNLAFEGIKFTEKCCFFAGTGTGTVIDGLTFEKCTFELRYEGSDNTFDADYVPLHGYGNVGGLVVRNCEFINCSTWIVNITTLINENNKHIRTNLTTG